jgi:lysophospholipid acyltransferase (LPLAT)-like uncharacterized protein
VKLKLPPAFVARVAPAVMRVLGATWRFDATLPEGADDVLQRRRAVVIVLWHEELLPILWRHRGLGISAVVSIARDGQYLADAAGRLGYDLIRGSSRRGATQALLGALRALEERRSVAFTPDGPIGPRRVAKAGAAAAAQRAGVPIVPIRAVVSRAWRFKSWDRFVVPKPFARVGIRYGELIDVGPGEDGLARAVTAMEEALNLLGDDP